MNIQDLTFLKAIDNERNKNYYAKIIILNKLDKPIKTIEGRVQTGSSININGSSSVRRTCSINLIAEETKNDLTNIENFLSINRKIKILIGIEKNIDYSKDIYYFNNKSEKYDPEAPYDHGFPYLGKEGKIYVDRRTQTYWIWCGDYQQIQSIYDYPSDIVWFPQGVFVINQPNITHSSGGCTINLSCKDKMCLLNGEMGGNLPTSITFDKYDQIIGVINCGKISPLENEQLEPNNYTVYKYVDSNNKVHFYMWDRKYGWKDNDNNKDNIGKRISIPQLIYDIIYTVVVNYGGEDPSRVIINDIPKEIKQLMRYIGSSPLYHDTKSGQYTTDQSLLIQGSEEGAVWETYEFNEDVGYTYTDFTYPGSLVTNIGENVCSVLDKIKNTLGNYEYFYDIDGNFVFQEIRNYLNTSFDVNNVGEEVQRYYLQDAEKNIESDSDDFEIHNLKIIGQDNYKVSFYGNQRSIYTFEESNGLITSYSNSPNYMNIKNDYHIWGKNSDGYPIHYHLVIKDKPTVAQKYDIVFLKKDNDDTKFSGKIRLAMPEDENNIMLNDGKGNKGLIKDYIPNDWRAELYLQGLTVAKGGGRPDIYQQELLDLFDGIYDWGYYDEDDNWIACDNNNKGKGRFKTDVIYCPNNLKYFIDYLEPIDKLYGISVDDIDSKLLSHQQDKIIKIYDRNVPNYIIIDETMINDYENELITKCNEQGQPHSVVDENVYQLLALGTKGYSAQETVRNFLYQYTTYNESITITSIPIYYLDVNKRITVKDAKSNIYGDYIIKSITLPLSPGSTMNITASRALDRI